MKYDERERPEVKEIDVTKRQNYRTGEVIDEAELWLRKNDPEYLDKRRRWIAPTTDALARPRGDACLNELEELPVPIGELHRPKIDARYRATWKKDALRLAAAGWSTRRIAKAVGVSRESVRRLLKSKQVVK